MAYANQWIRSSIRIHHQLVRNDLLQCYSNEPWVWESSGTVVFISILSDEILPAALLERKQRKDWVADLLEVQLHPSDWCLNLKRSFQFQNIISSPLEWADWFELQCPCGKVTWNWKPGQKTLSFKVLRALRETGHSLALAKTSPLRSQLFLFVDAFILILGEIVNVQADSVQWAVFDYFKQSMNSLFVLMRIISQVWSLGGAWIS